MLPAPARLRRSVDFAAAIARGADTRRVSRGCLIAHLRAPAPREGAAGCAKVGFVVSKAVGGAVVRNRVKRRLRAATVPRLNRLPPGAHLVVRATPAAAGATVAQLGADLDAALTRLTAGGRS